VAEEQLGDELAARAGPGLLEDRLQVVLHGVGRHVQALGIVFDDPLSAA
jgi:hypothetical protein